MLSGNSAPENRQALWLTGYPTGSGTLYPYITTLNTFRNHVSASDSGFLTAEPTYDALTDNVLSIRQGNMMVYISNEGSKAPTSMTFISTGWSADTILVDVMSCQRITADEEGNAEAKMNGGLPIALYPKSYLTGSGLCSL